MASNQMIVSGLDPTMPLLNSITGAQLLQMLNNATMFADKGLVVTTTDAGGIPQPPPANTTTFWQQFVWRRLDVNGKAYLYVWDASVVADAILLNWISINSSNIPANSIGSSQIIPGSVSTLQVGSIDFGKIIGFPSALTGDANGSQYPNVVVAANAITGTKIAASTIALANLAPEVLAAIQGNSTPSGIIAAYGATAAPAGWLLCDGSGVDRTVYANLYTAIQQGYTGPTGIQYGWYSGIGPNASYDAGGTANGFKLPDLRGIFIRGANGSVYDAGRAFGTLQVDGFASHTHVIGTVISGGVTAFSTSGTGPAFTGGSTGTKASIVATTTINNTGGSETRPVNLAINYIIKT